jgi:peptidoglycan/xylan/chitin deacetylase (PgdA/CDA1 family)
MFHSFDGKGSAAYTLDRFSELLQILHVRGYSFTSLKDLLKERSRPDLQKPRILLTIDDATEDQCEAVRICRLFKIPCVIAVPCGIQTLVTSQEISRRVMNEKELRDLVAGGYVELAAHGVSHHHLTELNDEVLLHELRVSLKFIQQLNPENTPSTLVYPRGRYDERVISMAHDVGFEAGFTTNPSAWRATTHLFQIPRYPVLTWMSWRDVIDELEGKGDRFRQWKKV